VPQLFEKVKGLKVSGKHFFLIWNGKQVGEESNDQITRFKEGQVVFIVPRIFCDPKMPFSLPEAQTTEPAKQSKRVAKAIRSALDSVELSAQKGGYGVFQDGSNFFVSFPPSNILSNRVISISLSCDRRDGWHDFRVFSFAALGPSNVECRLGREGTLIARKIDGAGWQNMNIIWEPYPFNYDDILHKLEYLNIMFQTPFNPNPTERMTGICVKCPPGGNCEDVPELEQGTPFAVPNPSPYILHGVEESKRRLFETVDVHLYWNTENHCDFPHQFRRVVMLLFLMHKRAGTVFNLLSKDVLQNYILPLLGLIYFNCDNAEEQEPRSSSTKKIKRDN
jgi:hypothetical protein